MSHVDVFNFDLKKITAEAKKLPDEERIKYLKTVIIEYQVEKGIFDTAYGAGLRMPLELSQGHFIHTLESEIEKCKKALYYDESRLEKARLHIEEALDTIEEMVPIIIEDRKLVQKFVQKLEKMIHHMEE